MKLAGSALMNASTAFSERWIFGSISTLLSGMVMNVAAVKNASPYARMAYSSLLCNPALCDPKEDRPSPAAALSKGSQAKTHYNDQNSAIHLQVSFVL